MLESALRGLRTDFDNLPGQMNKRFVVVGILMWSVIGVPLAFALSVDWLYYYYLGKGELPPPWFGIGLFVAYLLAGLASVTRLLVVRKKGLLIVVLIDIAYALLMGSTLFALGVIVACKNGDCL